MGRKRKSAGERRKKVNVSLLKRTKDGPEAYRIMDELVEKHHSHLACSKIVIAWEFGKKADADGRLWMGASKKASDLDRELHGYDLVIRLNHEIWNRAGFSVEKKRALLDHRLCEFQVSKDTDGETKIDEKNRTVYRLRKHDIREFREVYARHGCWMDDLKDFIEAGDRPLLRGQEDEPAKPRPEAMNGSANGQVKLLKSIEGYNSQDHGLIAGRKVQVVEKMPKGRLAVLSGKGMRVEIEKGAYEELHFAG